MSSKVEELRERVLGNYPKIATDKKGLPCIIGIIETVDSLISTVQERERERILTGSDFLPKGTRATLSNCLDDNFNRGTGQFEVTALEDCYILPASVLAPTKEEP